MKAPVHDLSTIKDFAGSYVLLARDPSTDTAVVFVHGFSGDPHSTWLEFPSLIDSCADEYPSWRTCDAYFYKYGGSRTIPIAVSSHRFVDFLRHIFPKPDAGQFLAAIEAPKLEDLFASVRPRGGEFRYKNLVLVGHSEGAVVIRRALVEEYKKIRDEGGVPVLRSFLTYEETIAARDRVQRDFIQDFPLFDATTVFFAPAHLGATVTGWAGVLVSLMRIGSVLAPVVDALKAYSASYHDLKSGSPFLNQLRIDTEKFALDFPQPQAFKAKSYFGEKDRIVCISEYASDAQSVLIRDKGHLSVCKPNRLYKEPLEHVKYGRKQRVSASQS